MFTTTVGHITIGDSRGAEVQRIILGGQPVGLDDATLILVLLIIERTSLQAMRVLCVQKLRTQQCLEHLLGIICGL